MITFGAGDLSEVVRHVPLERILLETDGPYMTPAPYRYRPTAMCRVCRVCRIACVSFILSGVCRGKVCHSGHVPFIAKKVGELKGVPLAQVLQAARDNTRRMYGV